MISTLSFSPECGHLPGVVSAAAVTPLPMSGNNSMITFQIEGRPVPKAEEPSADIKIVTPDYFHTFNIPINSGRDFTEHDNTNLRAWSW